MIRTFWFRTMVPARLGVALLSMNGPQKLTNLNWSLGSFVHSTSMPQEDEVASLGSVATSAARRSLGEN
jgi:hypothetical protein